MRRTPFDDHIAFNRRWGNPDSSSWKALADADPLLFVADHISSRDRREGSVALALTRWDEPSMLIAIPDAPRDPSDRDCLTAIGAAVERTSGRIRDMGIVHHRRGGVGITDVDRRWALALKVVSIAFDFSPIGVMARLHSGGLVRVALPEVVPEDYMEGVM